MGLDSVQIAVRRSHDARDSHVVNLLVDSGAVYSVVQEDILKSLRINPHRRRSSFLANGEEVQREIGDAYFEYQGVGGAAPVIFGKPGDSDLLGATTLEALELVLNPFQRELRPLSMSL